MSEDNVKYQQIVEAGKALFWKFGLNKVTVEEISSEANVSKVTFYKFFSNKIELLKYILQKMFDEGYKTYRDIMDSDIPFAGKAEKTIQMKMENAAKFSDVLLKDLYGGNQPELMAFMKKYAGESFRMIREDFAKAQKNGEIRADLSIDFLMYFLNKLTEMMEDEKLELLHENPRQAIREMTTLFFYGIIENGKNKNSK